MGIYIFVSILVIVACVLQVMIVLVQNSKGGGLAANFTSAGQTMGIRKTADFLEKSTWTLAAAILILCVVATASIPRGSESGQSRITNQINNAVDPNAIPTLPTAIPPASSTPSEGENQPEN
jgi:preprotein translocase subunit SecG